jgi:crotonobetainyl-CoA:carnitine CoA-transferase CaiB-like acyl-CoA transferase
VKRSPLLGEHTEEILGWLGYDVDAIAAMHKEGAV